MPVAVHRCEAKPDAWARFLKDEVLSLPRTNQCFSSIEADPKLGYKLIPNKNATAGQVLKHVFTTLERHLEKYAPSIYKIGYTHDPVWRFYNSHYGYVNNREKWEGMTVLYVSDESVSPAFVEAAAIQKHHGYLPESLYIYIYMVCETSWQEGPLIRTSYI